MGLTAKRLRELLDYDPETGVFKWKVKRKHMNVGDIAGSIKSKRYRHIEVDRKHYSAHRLAWLFHYGKWPTAWIDHINNDPFDNRICNLREATPNQNAYHRRGRSRSGVKGVYPRKNGKFEAWIMQAGVHYYLGQFATKQEAATAYANTACVLHGEFATTGG